jgi:hypothetical protein
MHISKRGIPRCILGRDEMSWVKYLLLYRAFKAILLCINKDYKELFSLSVTIFLNSTFKLKGILILCKNKLKKVIN